MPSPHLERKLKAVLGDDAGAELAAVTDRIDPIRGDIAELRHAMERGFAALEARLDAALPALEGRLDAALPALEGRMDAALPALEGRMDAAIERSAKEQTRFFFVAWGVLLAAIVGLYGTVVALLR